MDDYELQVARNVMFTCLDEAARQKVMGLARLRRFERGQTIIQEGAPDQDIYLLRLGRVEVQTMQEGFIIELSELGPGAVFGEVAEMTGSRRTATVVAKEQVELLAFPGPALVRELRRQPTASQLLEHITRHRIKEKRQKTFSEE
jgi:CRP-like cAMP-binding protein